MLTRAMRGVETSEPLSTEGQAPNYVVVCRGPNCRERGSIGLRRRLADLLRGRSEPRLVGYACFGQCEVGPNVVFYPRGEWYGSLAVDDAERVLAHASGAAPLDRPQLSLPADERDQHLRNLAELVATLERDAAGGRRGWPYASRLWRLLGGRGSV